MEQPKVEHNLDIDDHQLSFHPHIDDDGVCSVDGEQLSTEGKWDKYLTPVSVIACVIAVLMDPLFFFIPFIDEDNMCVGTDEAVRTTALTLRALTDFAFIVLIVNHLRLAVKSFNNHIVESNHKSTQQTSEGFGWLKRTKAMAKEISYRSFATDIFAIIPVPQVVGAFWYFSSIQRRTSCWQQAIARHCSDGLNLEECTSITSSRYSYGYKCKPIRKSALTVKTLGDSCPVNPLNASVFDFGVFGDVLDSGNMGNDGFRKKLFYFMWWGLKNLSNFGTDLNTTGYVWENCFAILTCAVGLILFAYLIGHMQECMQSAEENKVVKHKIQNKREEILAWMETYKVPEELRKKIFQGIKQSLEDNKDADLDNLFSLLPWSSIKSLKPLLCLSMLTKVPGLKNMEGKVLEKICHFLKPVIYSEKTILFGVGEPLDSMLFLVEGTVLIYSTGSRSDSTHQQVAGEEIAVGSPPMIHGFLENGGVYGHELLSWASPTDVPISYADLPISTNTVRCHTKVEGFVLIAKDLRTVVQKYRLNLNHSNSSNGIKRSTNGSGGTSTMIRRNPRPGTVGCDNSEESGI